MKEQDYINATDLTKLRNAQTILGDITQANQPAIENDQYTSVMQTLYRWISRIEVKIGARQKAGIGREDLLMTVISIKKKDLLRKRAEEANMNLSEYVRFLVDDAIENKRRSTK